MKKNRFLKFLKWLHKWPSLIVAVFLVCWAISGVVLNHRSTFSSFDIGRKHLAQEYQYTNWNNASLKGSCTIGVDSVLVFGNMGIWLTDSDFSEYQDFNAGFPNGIDHRKIHKVFKTKSGTVLAGTLFGLYKFDFGQNQWDKVLLPHNEERIIGIAQKGDVVFVMSRSLLFSSADEFEYDFSLVSVPANEGYDNKIGLFKTLWVIHSGEIYGQIGKLIVDFVAAVFVFLTITGLIYYFVPGVIKRRRKKSKDNSKVKKINKFSIKWHNKLGIYLIPILLLTTLTGMFLRPPLLIAIAGSRVEKLAYTNLDNPNPWFDRFRGILYDEELDRFLIGTVEGIYFSEDHFRTELKRPTIQPPVSVMGINVLEKKSRGEYLIGSFYGLYRWMPDYNYVEDYINKTTNIYIDRAGPPLGKFMSAGYLLKDDGSEFHIDYNYGAFPIRHQKQFAAMPEQIIKNSPMSIWNFALEIHTARFFKFLFGDFYILIVPLLGLLILTILVTGLVVWVKLFIRRK